MPSLLLHFSSVLLCSLVMSSFGITTTVHGEGRSSYVVGNITSLMASTTTCSTPPDLMNNSMKVTRPYGPCTRNSINYTVDHIAILNNDEIWVSYLQNRTLNPLESKSTFPIRKGWNEVRYGNYIVNVGLGTPIVQQKVAFDTGSTLSWVQCSPYCSLTTCRPQTDWSYNPYHSTTSKNVSCQSPVCSLLASPGCQQNKCTFLVTYGDKSESAGYLLADTLALTPDDVTADFVFGCAASDKDDLLGQVTGLFGLGRNPLSMVSQLSTTHGKVFSYCLPVSDNSVGFFNFGPTRTPGAVPYTPMLVSAHHSTFYGVGLTGISVNGQMLNIPPSVFSTAGTILDSGTVITRLPPTAYSELRRVFHSGMTGYRYAVGVNSILDTCYDAAGLITMSTPDVSLHFGNLQVPIAFANVMYPIATSTSKYLCLGFVGNPTDCDVGIIGNYQQKGIEIIHDLSYQRIGFAAGRC